MRTVRARRAFTVLELVLVIAIIFVVSAVLIPTFANLVHRAERVSVLNNLDKMNQAILNALMLNGEPLTAGDIKRILSEAGFDGIIKNRKSRYIYYWNELDGTVIAWDTKSEEVICPARSEEKYSRLEIAELDGFTALDGTENGESELESESITYIDSSAETPEEESKSEQATEPNGTYYIEISSDQSDDKDIEEALLSAIKGAKEEAFFIEISDAVTVLIADISEFNEALKLPEGNLKSVTLDLNGSTIEWTDEYKGINLSSGCSLTLANGSIKFTSSKEYDDSISAISVEAGAELILNNVTLTSINSACVSATNAASVKISECTLKGSSYGICVKKGTLSDPNSNTTIDIVNTDIEADVAVFCGTDATVNISDGSILNGKRNALIVRVGNITINDSTLKIDTLPAKVYLYTNFVLGFEDGYWQSGSAVPAAVLTLGDYSEDDTEYTGAVEVELTNVTLKSPNASKVPKILLAAHSENKTVALVYDDGYSCEIEPEDIAVYGVDLVDDVDLDISPEHLGTMTVNGEMLICDE